MAEILSKYFWEIFSFSAIPFNGIYSSASCSASSTMTFNAYLPLVEIMLCIPPFLVHSHHIPIRLLCQLVNRFWFVLFGEQKNATKCISPVNTTNVIMHFVTFLISYENILFSEKLIYCNLQFFRSQPLRKLLLPDHHRYQLLRTALLHFLHLQIHRTGYG